MGNHSSKLNTYVLFTREWGRLYGEWFCNNVLLNAVKVLAQRTRNTLHEIFPELQSHEHYRGKITLWLLQDFFFFFFKSHQEHSRVFPNRIPNWEHKESLVSQWKTWDSFLLASIQSCPVPLSKEEKQTANSYSSYSFFLYPKLLWIRMNNKDPANWPESQHLYCTQNLVIC